jgi:hypothetical protein
MTDKYGFIYLWFDKKHKRYYVGSHWGFVADGYICSSRWMRKSYRRRSEDFKRRILQIVPERKNLFAEEQRWLDMIKDRELRKRYYNLSKSVKDPWYQHPEKRLTIGQKISLSKSGKPCTMTPEQLIERGRKVSAAKQVAKQRRLEETGFSTSEKQRNANHNHIQGKKRSPASRAKQAETLKQKWADGSFKGMTGHTFKQSDHQKQTVSKLFKGKRKTA